MVYAYIILYVLVTESISRHVNMLLCLVYPLRYHEIELVDHGDDVSKRSRFRNVYIRTVNDIV